MIVRPGAVLVRAQFHILDDDGNVIDTKSGPEKVIHHPHTEALQKHLDEGVEKLKNAT